MRTRDAGWRLGGAALTLLLLLTACGGAAAPSSPASSDTSPAASSAPPAGGSESPSAQKPVDPRAGGLDTGFGEFAITTEAKAIRPGPVTFVVRNGGTLVHGFELESESQEDGNSGGSGHGDRFKIEAREFGPGQVVRVQTNLPAGVYKIKCYISNHEKLGMRTILTVKESAPLVKPAKAAAGEIDLQGFAYSPAELTVPVGTTVTWVNKDPASHTVSADDSSFQSDVLDSGGRFEVRMTKAGTISYHCAIHPSMKGTIVVR
jgi:plastocyanin